MSSAGDKPLDGKPEEHPSESGEASASETSSARIRSGAERTESSGALDATAVFREVASASTTRPSLGAPPLALDATRPATPEAKRGPTEIDCFGPYSRIEVLAEQGSIGVVARGFNDAFGRWELLKFLREELADQLEVERQFKREGRVLAQLSHPNVVQVFATYDVEGRTCLAMEFLEGKSLAAYVDAEPLSAERGHELLLDAARGLAAAHEVGLLHRDVKPDNLFVTSAGRGRMGGLKLIDFGLATADRAQSSSISDPALVSGTAGGTPLYMAPELWLGKEASARSDLYALGLSFYYAFARRTPFEGASIAEVRKSVLSQAGFESLAAARPDLPQALVSIIDRLMQKQAGARYQSAEALVLDLSALGAATRKRRIPASGPYRGLEPYSENERDVFFGRDAEIAEVCERLVAHPAVVLVGPSGSGKSSLAFAGVAPTVAEGALGGGVLYKVASLKPAGQPLRALASALAEALGGDAAELKEICSERPRSLGARVAQQIKPPSGLLLVVDQLEQLATRSSDSRAALSFAEALASLAEAGVRILATLRADLMDRLFSLEPLRQLLTRGFYPVRPLLGDALTRALLEPARVAGFDLEDPQIAESIVRDVARTRAGLPLMSFAMAAWWRARDDERKLLPASAWHALGGLAGALTRHADTVLDSLGPEERRVAEQILVRLVTGDNTRALARRELLVDPAVSGTLGARALDRLLSERLLTETAGEIELAHDALITSWPRLTQLLSASSEDRVFSRRVEQAAAEWETAGHADGALWHGEQAERLLRWFESSELPLSQLELAFIDATRKRKLRRRLLLRSVGLGGALLLLVFALVQKTQEVRLSSELAALKQSSQANKQKSDSHTQALLRQLAAEEADDDPLAALRHAVEGREKGEDAALDAIAWQAKLNGVAKALPHHPGGAWLVGFGGPGSPLLSAGADKRVLELPFEGGGGFAASGVSGRPSLVRYGEKELAIATSAGALYVGSAGGREFKRVAGCARGSVRELWFRSRSELGVMCGSDAHASVLLISLPVGRRPGAARTLFEQPGGLLALSTDHRRIARVVDTELSIVSLESSGQLGSVKLTSPPTAFAIGSSAVLLGDAAGRLSVVQLDDQGKPGKPQQAESPHMGKVTRIFASPEQTAFVSFDRAGRAALWADGNALTSLSAGPPLVHWIRKRRLVAVADAEHRVALLSTDVGKRLGRLTGAAKELTSIASHGDSSWLLSSSLDGGVRAYDLNVASARVVHRPAEGRCALAADATSAGCVHEGRLEVAPLESRADERSTPRSVALGAGSAVKGAVIAGQRAERMAWLNADGALSVVAGERVALHDLGLERGILAISPRGRLAIAEHGESAVRVLEAGGALVALKFPGKATALSFGSDENRLLIGTEDGSLVELDTERETPLSSKLSSHALTAVQPSEDGATLVAGDENGALYLWSSATRRAKLLHQGSGAVRCVLWAKNGRAVIAGDQSGMIILLDSESGAATEVVGVRGKLAGCARRQSDDFFAFMLEDGLVWERRLDLEPIWMLQKPIDPRDAGQATLEQFRGLAEGRQ